MGERARLKEETREEATLKALKKSRLYSEELDISLKKRPDAELFKWFLASVLFGARISGTIAERTYRAFEKYNRLTPEAILDAGWDFLVNPIMREGGYVRYDEKTSREILSNCQMLIADYQGSLNGLHEAASDVRDLERRLLAFYAVGPVTVNIFLRELRPFWKKADPDPLPVVFKAARKYGIDLTAFNRKSITFARIEAGLVRLRHTVREEA